MRATHPKTLELSIDANITERATCVIAVDAKPAPEAPMAGPVRIEIRAGGETFIVRAQANSGWDPGRGAVIRRSPLQLPGTLATHADAGASALPRSLVEALRSPATIVEVTLDPVPSTRDTVVLFAADLTRPAGTRLAAELAVADTVHVEDAGARRLLAQLGADPPQAHPQHAGRRVLVLATQDLPGKTALLLMRHSAIETAGLTARLAAAAACSSRGPLVLAPDDADPRELLRVTPAGHRLLLTTGVGRLRALLALAKEVRGGADAVLAQEHAPPVRVLDGQVPELPSKDTVYCCLDPAPTETGVDLLDPGVRAAIVHLLEDGVSTRTAARVLADLTGCPRRDAYAVVLGMDRTGTPHNPGHHPNG